MPADGLPRLFVSIASYRDSECQWTVKDLFEKARHPDRIFVGICWQFVPGDDDDCFVVETRPEQVRMVKFHAKDSMGACWARHHTQGLWRGEEYTLQIDSHMRFVQDWDEKLFTMLAECSSPRAVLTTYPIGYTPPDALSPDALPTIYAKEFDKNGILMFRSASVPPAKAPPTPQPTPFVAGGFLFGSSEILTEVPYDPYLYFQGEEITLAARLWTHGWDLYTPNRVICYHDYTKRPGRKRHWHDATDWTALNERSFARVRHLLGMEESSDPEVLREIDRYGLGSRRSLAEYQAFSKVDFANRLIDGKNRDEIEAGQPSHEKRRRCQEVFTAIWTDNGWRCAESRSGDGATLARTEVIRAELPRLFDFLGIRILGDAGCGDLNWISRISGPLRLYLGFDIVEGLVDEVRKRYADRRNHFFAVADIASEVLPACDAILCRDVLTHLPAHMVLPALSLFRKSGSRYFIATTFQRGRNDAVRLGGWQAMDLNAPPYTLPPPRLLISEGLAKSTKALGVWAMEDLPEG